MGTKYMCFAFNNNPMFFAAVPSASLVDTAKSTGRSLRKCALQASVTGVSVTPFANLASVLPVAGAITKISNSFFGPIGSAAKMVWIIS